MTLCRWFQTTISMLLPLLLLSPLPLLLLFHLA
jgi:hypothetical protein